MSAEINHIYFVSSPQSGLQTSPCINIFNDWFKLPWMSGPNWTSTLLQLSEVTRFLHFTFLMLCPALLNFPLKQEEKPNVFPFFPIVAWAFWPTPRFKFRYLQNSSLASPTGVTINTYYKHILTFTRKGNIQHQAKLQLQLNYLISFHLKMIYLSISKKKKKTKHAVLL